MNFNHLLIILIFFLTISCCFATSNETNNDANFNMSENILPKDELNESTTINYLNISSNYTENNRTDHTYLNESDNPMENTINNLDYGANAIGTTITADNLTKYYSETGILYAYLKDSNGNPLSGKTISFKVKNVIYNRITNSDGRAQLGINLYPGTCIANMTFSESGYQSSNKIVTIQVKPMPTTLEIENLSFIYGEEGNIVYATLKNRNNTPIPNMNITHITENQTYISTTDSNGQISIVVTKYPGTYYFNYIFDCRGYVTSNKIIKVTVLPIPVTMTSSNLMKKYTGNNFDLNFYPKDKYNNPLTNQNLTYTIDESCPYHITTNSNGCAKLTLNLNPKIYNITFYANTPYKIINSSFILKLYEDKVPCINYKSGFYNKSHIIINLDIVNAGTINYSWNNQDWYVSNQSLTFKLTNGEYNLYYKGQTGSPIHEHYIIDNKAPLVWSNYVSDLYDTPITVNISSWDNLDENPQIYYTLDGTNPKENGTVYQNPITIINTTTLKYYAKDYVNQTSDITICNYIFNNVGNINTGKGYINIQSAINDIATVNGDTILVKSGYYIQNIILNKSLNLISKNATITESSSTLPVIDINTNGSGSLIYGFNIINSTQAININNASNVSIINNTFHNVLNSIIVKLNNNTIIANNTINTTDFYYSSLIGIEIDNSKNLLITNNLISLYFHSGSAIRIINKSNNVYITNNQLTHKKYRNGYGIYAKGSKITVDTNHIENFARGISLYVQDSILNNNTLTNNVRGISLIKSINNIYKTNNVYNNKDYGVYLSASLNSYNDSFYLNRICDNGNYDLYSNSSLSYTVNDNWWGETPPKTSTNETILASIYNRTGNIVLDSWIVMNVGSCSYKIDDNGFIEKAKFYVDMTYNNLGQCLSYKGFLPDNLEGYIACFNINGNYKSNISYLKNGLGIVEFELSDLFNNYETIYLYARLDYYNVTYIFNKLANIYISVASSAWDINRNYFMNYNTHINFADDTYWITVSWSETGLYAGVINIIINGEIVESINISNLFYQCYKNEYRSNVFEAMKLFNNILASTHEGLWSPNNYYLNFANAFNLNPLDFNLVSSLLLSYIQLVYNLNDDETDFIRTNHALFVDFVEIGIDYHGEKSPNINFDYDGRYRYLSLPCEYAHRISNIYYTNIDDEYGISIGYEGMRSFAITKSNLTNGNLSYWLNQKNSYPEGLMKAAYGTFLTAILVIYENDRVADEAALRFNVTWSRTVPVCVSLCNDYNCLYITGESDHKMAREAIGNKSDVWKFNFATSFSFSLLEQLVGNNIWNDTTIGSVTLGLLQSYLNNETLEIFTSNGCIFIKKENDNSALLFLDTKTGIVRDEFSYYGLLGTMPCYHNNITENAWQYGTNLLNQNSKEHQDLISVSNYTMDSVFFKTNIQQLFGDFDYESFLVNLSIGSIGSELLSASFVFLAGGILTGDAPVAILGLILFSSGEYAIAYSDGLLDGEITYLDLGFFIFDNIISIYPFSRGIKLGSQITKVTIERIVISTENDIIFRTNYKISNQYIKYDIDELFLRNLHDDPLKQQVIQFFKYSILPLPFRYILENELNE